MRRPPQPRQGRLPFADVRADQSLSPIAPPIPAPYLVGVPHVPQSLFAALDAGQLTPKERARSMRYIAFVARLVKASRRRYEQSIGRMIQSEEPWRP